MMVVLLIVICWIGTRGGTCTKAGGLTHGRSTPKAITGTGRKNAPIGGGGGASTKNAGGGGRKNTGGGGGGKKPGPSNTTTGWLR